MRRRVLLALLCLATCGGVAAQTSSQRPPAAPPGDVPAQIFARLQREVMDAERAFAQTLAERDHAAFVTFLADDAVFFSGQDVQRGKAAVAAAWKRFFEGGAAPFSWEPDQVEVLESGTLALSTGPVRDPSGKATGRFNSIWRRTGANGPWKIVFDKGEQPCRCGAPQSATPSATSPAPGAMGGASAPPPSPPPP